VPTATPVSTPAGNAERFEAAREGCGDVFQRLSTTSHSVWGYVPLSGIAAAVDGAEGEGTDDAVEPAPAAPEAQSPASSSVARPPALAVRRRKSASSSSSASPYPTQISSMEAFIPE
jgi:hypothetical protein